jgi:hypothetical protein
MIVNYDGEEYKLDLDELDLAEAMVIKVKTSMSLMKFQAGLEEMDPDALRALYWLMMKQNGKAVDIDRVNFKVSKFASAVTEAQKEEPAPEVTPTKQQASGS